MSSYKDAIRRRSARSQRERDQPMRPILHPQERKSAWTFLDTQRYLVVERHGQARSFQLPYHVKFHQRAQARSSSILVR